MKQHILTVICCVVVCCAAVAQSQPPPADNTQICHLPNATKAATLH